MEDRVLDGNKDELEMDLGRLFIAIWRRIWIVILAVVVGAVIAGAGTYFFITPQYQSSAMFYVNNSSLPAGDSSTNVTSSDISASKSLVDSYIVILKADVTLKEIADYAGVNRTYSELGNMISAAAVNSTEIFEVVVTSPDPAEAEKIANAIAYILPTRISSIIDGTSAQVVDYAAIATNPSSPNYTKNILLGAMLGALLSVAIIILKELFDTTIRTEEDIEHVCKHPVLALVPDMAATSKGGYYYGSSKRKKKRIGLLAKEEQKSFVGGDISFAASEAYKMLRTKLQFSFADENDSYVIGVSSALAGEGKSLSAINLAYSLAQLSKKVLLVDCDMRRPSVAEKLSIKKDPGLSSYLTRQVNIGDVIQVYKTEDGGGISVISAGQNPPNPVELLSSVRMSKAVEAFREVYDYIILDLPPVDEVSDAMAVAKITDGMLLVVRQNYCDRVVLESTVQQFEFVDSRILGVVMNCTTDHGSGYGKYGKYRRYYGKYHRGYAYTYAAAAKSSSQQHNKKAR